jgi:hypothetical protein
MNSPLEYDAELVKEFNIDKASDIEDEVKLGFVRRQLEEYKSALWRERVDTLSAAYQVDKADDEIIKNQHQGKVNEHRLMIKQFVRTIKVLTALQDELEAKVTTE